MKYVYIVFQGHYSDRSVDAVFSERWLAEQYCLKQGTSDMETVELDRAGTTEGLKRGKVPYYIQMDRDGNSRWGKPLTEEDDYGYPHLSILRGEPISKWTIPPAGPPGFFEWHGYARSPKHAIKIANDARRQLIAEGRLP